MRGGRDDAFLGGLLGGLLGSAAPALLAVARGLGFYGLMAVTVVVVLVPGWVRVALLLAVLAGIGAALYVGRAEQR